MPLGLDIAAVLATGLAGWTMLRLASRKPAMMRATITTMRPRGPGRTRES